VNAVEHDVTVRFMDITGPSGVSTAGVFIGSGSVQFESVRVDGGAGSENSIGLAVTGGSVTVERSDVRSGKFGSGHGVYAADAGIDIRDSVVHGGKGTNSVGVSFTRASGSVCRSEVYGGNSSDLVAGVEIRSTTGVLLCNNLIDAGTGLSTSGVIVTDATATIANNIIHGGGALAFQDDTAAEALWLYDGGKPEVYNNILYVSSGQRRYGVSRGPNSTPEAMADNSFFCKDCTFTNVYDDYAEDGNDAETVSALNTFFGLSGGDVNVADAPVHAALRRAPRLPPSEFFRV